MQSTLSQPTRPAEPTAAPRPDLYAPIHKALRHAMTDTLLEMGRIDVADAAPFNRTLGRVDALLDLCAGHLVHENAFVHPALEACEPGASARIAHEHVEHEQAIAALRDEVAALRRSAPAARDALALFVAHNFEHMHVEETAHNAVLWAHYSDAELMQLHEQIVGSIAPEEMLQVMDWMLPALTPAERALVGGPPGAGAAS